MYYSANFPYKNKPQRTRLIIPANGVRAMLFHGGGKHVHPKNEHRKIGTDQHGCKD